MMHDLKQLSASFAADGFVTLDRLWSPAEVQEVETELERFLVECVPRMEKVHKTFTEGWKGEVKSLGGLDLYDGYFKELGNHPLMRQIASSLLGDEALFVAIEFFSRPPGSDAIGPYHQDNGYFCYQPAEALAFWIALDDVDAQNGGVVYARGSHRGGLLPHQALGIHGFSQQVAEAGEQLQGYEEIVGVLPRGGCSVHHCLTAHRSGPNPTQRPRRAIVADYRTARAVESQALREQLDGEREKLLKRISQRGN